MLPQAFPVCETERLAQWQGQTTPFFGLVSFSPPKLTVRRDLSCRRQEKDPSNLRPFHAKDVDLPLKHASRVE